MTPRTTAQLFDASIRLLAARPVLLVALGGLHVVPLGAALAALVTLPGRGFALQHPSPPLAALSLLAAAAVLLRPLSLAAVGMAVSRLVRGEEPSAGMCLGAARARARDLWAAASRALILDLFSVGILRLSGAYHLVAVLVGVEGLGAHRARREAARLRGSFFGAHWRVNLHYVTLYLAVLLNFWLGVFLSVQLAHILMGFELTTILAFVSPLNGGFLLLVAALSAAALEPLRAVVKSLLLIDLRLREEGTDLKIRLTRVRS